MMGKGKGEGVVLERYSFALVRIGCEGDVEQEASVSSLTMEQRVLTVKLDGE